MLLPLVVSLNRCGWDGSYKPASSPERVWPSARLTVTAPAELTTLSGRVVLVPLSANCSPGGATNCTVQVPGVRLPKLYVPLAAVVVVAFTVPPAMRSTVIPLAAVSLLCQMPSPLGSLKAAPAIMAFVDRPATLLDSSHTWLSDAVLGPPEITTPASQRVV